MTTSEQIIERIFGSPDRVPVYDRTAYIIPVEFWQRVEAEINDFRDTGLQYTTFIRLSELAREYRYYETFLKKCIKFLRNVTTLPTGTPAGLFDIESFISAKLNSDEHFDITALNDHLLDIFRDNGLRLHADLIDTRRKQRFGMKKRDIVREAYREYEEKLTSEAYRIECDTIKFPELMLDRVVWMIYSDEHISFKGDIKDTISANRSGFDFMVMTDRAEYTRRDYLAANYTDEEVNEFVPHNLDDEFDLIKHRSVLTNYDLTSKPKLVRDGIGWSYLWQTAGVTYRFNHDPPQGRAVSLMMLTNMQVLTWQEILNRESNTDELQTAYDNEFLKESNFIPTGYEHLYRKYECEVFHNLISKSTKTYHEMMGSIGFPKITSSTLNARVMQAELCWNKSMPLDLGSHLWHRYDVLRKIGLNPELHAKTPLLHTPFSSDVDTGFIRFDHKEYRKSKRVFRNEIIFMSELKNHVDLREISTRRKPGTISDYFIDDLELTKKYLYYKLHRRYDQMDGTSEHGYYDWRNSSVDLSKYRIHATLTNVLQDYPDLPSWLKDVKQFDVLVDQEHLTRKFFTNLSKKQYELRVQRDPLFQKTGHGRYRLDHPAVLAYRKVRDALNRDHEQVTISQS